MRFVNALVGEHKGAGLKLADEGLILLRCVWLLLALASFYLGKAHITIYNKQLIRPHRHCAHNNIIAGAGDLDVCRQPRLGKTVAHLRILFF
jgi:hypothetical protein